MKSESDLLLNDIELPSIDIDLSVDAESANEPEDTFSTVPEIGENQILAEGAGNLQGHPHLEPLMEKLLSLQNEMIQKVNDASADFELSGFVKVLFAISKK